MTTIHEIHHMHGDTVVVLGAVMLIGPVTYATITDQGYKDTHGTDHSWMYRVFVAGIGPVDLFYVEDQAQALLERGRLVEALREHQGVMSADVRTFGQEQKPITKDEPSEGTP